MSIIERTEDEVEEVKDIITEYLHDKGVRTKYAGMTYEQGVIDTIEWLLGEQEEAPSDEYKTQ